MRGLIAGWIGTQRARSTASSVCLLMQSICRCFTQHRNSCCKRGALCYFDAQSQFFGEQSDRSGLQESLLLSDLCPAEVNRHRSAQGLAPFRIAVKDHSIRSHRTCCCGSEVRALSSSDITRLRSCKRSSWLAATVSRVSLPRCSARSDGYGMALC